MLCPLKLTELLRLWFLGILGEAIAASYAYLLHLLKILESPGTFSGILSDWKRFWSLKIPRPVGVDWKSLDLMQYQMYQKVFIGFRYIVAAVQPVFLIIFAYL